MYYVQKIIKGKKYKYAARSVRLPDGRVVSLNKKYGGESRKELEKIFERMEREENTRYVVKRFGTDHIFTKDQLGKMEEIRLDYRKIIRKIPKESIQDLWDRFTVNFTYESNALEGNSLTLKDVAIVMFENASIKGKDLREIYETRNSRQVVDMIIRNKFDVSHGSIIKMHRILVKDISIRTGYKKIPNFILGRKVETTPPEKVYGEMDKLISWYDENTGKIHPVKLAAIFHGKFERIHPFEDGNGRVGRFLMNIILTKGGYPPLIIRKSQRVSYLKTLESFDSGHQDALVRFTLEKFKETYRKFFEVYVKYV